MSDLLALAHVDVGFATDDGVVSAVSDVSLTLEEGEIFG
ncbi:MAG: ABC transporter ATP-binding protein, partial [Acidobacteria bacterium]|nr:ABC transporter ATP-binding protein [Acidobacteriota bacterium]